MNSENPYSTPVKKVASSIQSNKPIVNESSLGAVAKRTFLTWERLRLGYIAILALVSISCFMIFRAEIQLEEFILTIIFGGIFANLCFFAGPIIETYVRWLGFPTLALRVALFAIGTLFASALAVVAIHKF